MNVGDYKAYVSAETMMGPNSIRILAELFDKYPLQLAPDDRILDLGCGTGLTSLVIAKETGAKVFANDLWISAEENRMRFAKWGVEGQITPVCEDASHLPFDKNALGASDFSYIALGHVHKPEILIPDKMAYPGSPEPLDKTETGVHGIIRGEIHDSTRKVTSLEFLPLCRSQYIPLAVNITPATTNTELEMKISQEIERRGRHHIYRFRIRGMRDPEMEFDLENLLSKFRIVEITDESEPQYDFSALFAEHPSDMIGFYIRALQKPDMSAVEKKALYYGINALLRTTDERSPS